MWGVGRVGGGGFGRGHMYTDLRSDEDPITNPPQS